MLRVGVTEVLIGAVHCSKSVFFVCVCVYKCEREKEIEKEREVSLSHTANHWVSQRVQNDTMRWHYLP